MHSFNPLKISRNQGLLFWNIQSADALMPKYGLWFRFIAGMILLLLIGTAFAQVAVPDLSRRVTDLTGTMTTEQASALENKLAAFESEKGSQIAVLIIASTQPEDIAAFGIRVADAWKIGRKNINDGVILIVAKNDRRLRLEVGYGLEGAIPDAIAKRIIDETITPYFKQGDFSSGIDAGITKIIALIRGEALPAAAAHQAQPDNLLALVFFILLLFSIFVLGILTAKQNIEWNNERGGSSWDSDSGGSDSWGGGGGGFGGGGASGSW